MENSPLREAYAVMGVVMYPNINEKGILERSFKQSSDLRATISAKTTEKMPKSVKMRPMIVEARLSE